MFMFNTRRFVEISSCKLSGFALKGDKQKDEYVIISFET